jgi:hypothetical protein
VTSTGVVPPALPDTPDRDFLGGVPPRRLIVMARQEWQHSGVSEVLFCRDRCGVSIVESYEKALVQVASRWCLVKYVPGEPFGYLVDVEILDLFAPNVENRLGDPEFELAAVTHSHECEEIVAIELG